MGYPVVFSAQSNRDLGQIVRFLAQKNPAAAERLGHALVDRALFVGTMPHMGTPVHERSSVRRVIHRPWFLIYYRVDEAVRMVEIIRIWDARQNPADFSLR